MPQQFFVFLGDWLRSVEHDQNQISIGQGFNSYTMLQLAPLSNISQRDNLRIGLRSSAWVMGRLLKLLAFAHDEGIAVKLLEGNNILLEPERHFVVVFDWSMAQLYPVEVPATERRSDISSAARAVLHATGADAATGVYPYPSDEAPKYVQFIWHLASRRESNAEEAHTQFYELVDALFGRKFLPFQTLPR